MNKYKLIYSRRFLCGSTSFECKAGTIVVVKQVDKNNKKVLIDFGNGLIDWFFEGTIDRCFKPIS